MQSLPLLSLLLLFSYIQAQNPPYRSYTGRDHNKYHPTWGMVKSPLGRRSPALYSDDMYAPRKAQNGNDLPSARLISEIVFGGMISPMPMSPRGLTDFLTYWGQFLDHDLTFTSGDPGGNTNVKNPIVVPKGDSFFDPTKTGNVTIEFYRGIITPGSGNSTYYPAVPLNLVTSWFDGSQIYGSDDNIALYLRSGTNGTLKENPQYPGFPPFNTDINSPIKMQTAGIANQSELFIFGDARGNENPGLTALQILFFREHNRRARLLAATNPSWDDETIYQEARKMVIAILHHITEEEYMTVTLGEHLPEYEVWQSNLSPSILVDFSTGAFRYGHSEVNSQFNIYYGPNNSSAISLREAYFRPAQIIDKFDALIAGMFLQRQARVDTVFVDDLRNYLFGNPGTGGLDLTAINTQRGRDHGLPGFNTFRMNFGLDPYEDWDDINPDPVVWQALASVYSTIDDCDVYVCGLAEPPHTINANVGETFYTVIKEQYLRTRDGEPQWYETPDYLPPDQLKESRQTFLSHVILHNTKVDPELIPCYVLALPDGCSITSTPQPQPKLEDNYDFVVTLMINDNTGPTDDLENYYVLAINGVPQQSLTLYTGINYTFYCHISCNDAFIITDVLDDTAPISIDGQFGCLHQNPIVTLYVDDTLPTTLYYDSALHPSMGGNITIVSSSSSIPTPEESYSSSVVIGLGVALGVVFFVLTISLFYLFKKGKGYEEIVDMSNKK